MYKFDTSTTFQQLQAHRSSIEPRHLRELFESDPQRFAKMSLHVGPLLLDYSKNRITNETLSLLFQLARESGIEDRAKAMFRGEKINTTENRAVLHTALRNRANT